MARASATSLSVPPGQRDTSASYGYDARRATPEQHSLPRSIALHLLPGAALFGFVVAVASLGVSPLIALLAGIALVIVPLELGYLLFQGRRRNGTWSLTGVVDYREPLATGQIVRWSIPLVLWFIVIIAVSIAVLDEWLAETAFAWYPEAIRELAAFEDDGATPSTVVVVLVFAAALAINGVLGPVVEELYFRGHLLPRIDRLGAKAPVLNTVLFSLYHLWTPWQNPARILAALPWITVVWRKRSLRLSMAVHIGINTIFLLLVVPAFL